MPLPPPATRPSPRPAGRGGAPLPSSEPPSQGGLRTFAALLLATGLLSAPTPAEGPEQDSAALLADRLPVHTLALSPAQPTEFAARFFSGQVFLSWRERPELTGERYRIYRWDRPITATNVGSAIFLYEVCEGSSAYWSDYWPCASGCAVPTDQWEPRFSATMPLAPPSGDFGTPADPDQGMLVWTLAPEDMLGIATNYYYAVTTVNAVGVENLTDFSTDNRAGPIAESIESPRPLEIQTTVDGGGVTRHVYVQYMDLHTFNPTLTAPNAVHQSYGQNLSDPDIAGAIQYAFSYVVLEPPPPQSTPLPVVLKLHPYLRDTFGPTSFLDAVSNFQVEENYDYPAIEIRPIDVGSTWWFGFADKSFDYRQYADPCEAIDAMAATAPTIRNFTEARVMRMVYDLQRDMGYWAGKVDTERTYVVGHSMGGGGALAMALRYPDVFTAAYATAPVCDFRRLVDPSAPCLTPVPGSIDCPKGFQYDLAFDVALKWGPPGLGSDPFQHVYPSVCSFDNPPGHVQPVLIDGPDNWAAPLQVFNGTPVYDWQDHIAHAGSPPLPEVAPINVRHSSTDTVVNWTYQGLPLYEQLNDADLVWGGLVEDFLDHLKPWWFLGIAPDYADIPSQGPFFGLSAVLTETVPGLSLGTVGTAWVLPPPSVGVHVYNADFPSGVGTGSAIEWSSSWNPWDGAPVDTFETWGVSLRTVDGTLERVDVTPRRVQTFPLIPGKIYSWELTRLNGNRVDCGCAVADANGKLTIEDVALVGEGRRLRISKDLDLSCRECLIDPNLYKAPLVH